MQTTLPEHFKQTDTGKRADQILRSCVHCGFCNATCPTYQLTGDELDGPRGRIYIIKQLIEDKPASLRSLNHLDRCLTCRACETTCPSGVQYARLLDIGRAQFAARIKRPLRQRLLRNILRFVLPYPRRVAMLLGLAPLYRSLLPDAVRRAQPRPEPVPQDRAAPTRQHPRRILLLDGCVQAATRPNINAALARVLDRLGISTIVVPGSGCCGAVSHHLAANEQSREFMRRNINAWWPHIESGVEAVITSSSACSLMIKDYGELLADDPVYAGKAATIAAKARDISELLADEDLSGIAVNSEAHTLALQLPCSAQHGQSLGPAITRILTTCGFRLQQSHDDHTCCGAAGTYTILQPQFSDSLREKKLAALQATDANCIVTANIGCLLHLQDQASVPVRHWLELLDS